MPRVGKVGIDYFSHDVDMLQDKKLRILKAKHNLLGYAVYLRLLEEIYRDNGYYIIADDNYNILFADENNLDYNVYILILNDCINIGLFDKSLYEQYSVLTSRRIQENYCRAIERRKEVAFIKDFLLIDVNKHVNIKAINVNILSLNVDSGTQSKSKEKEKEKVNKDHQDLPQSSSNICSPEVDPVFLDMSLKFHKKQKLNGYYHVDFKNGINENSKVVVSGADTLRKIHEIDGEEIEDIEKVLEFILKDDFWRDQVISLSGLRGRKGKDGNYKYFTIKNKMLRDEKKGSSSLFREVMEKVEKMEEEK